jgi:hypothetical protein
MESENRLFSPGAADFVIPSVVWLGSGRVSIFFDSGLSPFLTVIILSILWRVKIEAPGKPGRRARGWGGWMRNRFPGELAVAKRGGLVYKSL